MDQAFFAYALHQPERHRLLQRQVGFRDVRTDRSAAECAGKDALAIMLTGMGDDGARGMVQMHDRGARTVAQDEQTCVVFGMPKEAIRMGAVDDVMPLGEIAEAILRFDARAWDTGARQ